MSERPITNELPTAVVADAGAYTEHMNRLYRKAKREQPRCFRCGTRVNFSKARRSKPLCYACEAARTDAELEAARERVLAVEDDNHRKLLPHLREIREGQNWGYWSLSKASGVSRQNIVNIEKGGAAQKRTRLKLCEALGVEEAELMGEA